MNQRNLLTKYELTAWTANNSYIIIFSSSMIEQFNIAFPSNMKDALKQRKVYTAEAETSQISATSLFQTPKNPTLPTVQLNTDFHDDIIRVIPSDYESSLEVHTISNNGSEKHSKRQQSCKTLCLWDAPLVLTAEGGFFSKIPNTVGHLHGYALWMTPCDGFELENFGHFHLCQASVGTLMLGCGAVPSLWR